MSTRSILLSTVGITLTACAIMSACAATDIAAATSTSTDIPAVYRKYSADVKVSVDGDYVVLVATGVPDHKSPYFASTSAKYEAYNGTNPNFGKAPGVIDQQSYTIRIPAHPSRAATSAPTPLGPIGLALNGVPFFNQYNGQNRPLTVEIDSFDQYNGHPTPTNAYHYHAEPTWLTKSIGSDKLLGFLLDGFPVYGPVENGVRVTNAALDQLHGHVGKTAEYPDGIYHYHITDADPYINGAGFYGTAGTVGR
ncbi:hypothetical protein BH09GEM1_BH09GEM1_33900 [soil metagenome]